MSVASEITRLQTAKSNLKAAINSKTDSEHQITDETIDEYSDFVDSITTGGGSNKNVKISTEGITYESTYPIACLVTEIDNFDMGNITNMTNFFRTSKITTIPQIDTSKVTNMTNLFYECKLLENIPLIDTSKVTDMNYMFYNCRKLTSIPQIDTSKATTMQLMFTYCEELTTLPVLDTSSVTTMSSAFSGCYKLTDESLNNVLIMCANATSYTGTKTFYNLGFRKNYYSAVKIQSLPNYQDFLDAGWTIGY